MRIPPVPPQLRIGQRGVAQRRQRGRARTLPAVWGQLLRRLLVVKQVQNIRLQAHLRRCRGRG